jgi:hypothetical protein
MRINAPRQSTHVMTMPQMPESLRRFDPKTQPPGILRHPNPLTFKPSRRLNLPHLECVHPQEPLPTRNDDCVVGNHAWDPKPVSKALKGVQCTHVASAQGQRMYAQGLDVGMGAVAGALQLMLEQDGLTESNKMGVCGSPIQNASALC